jgi:hypothetical protein
MPAPDQQGRARGAVRDVPNAGRIAATAAEAFAVEYGRGPGAAIAVIIAALGPGSNVRSGHRGHRDR